MQASSTAAHLSAITHAAFAADCLSATIFATSSTLILAASALSNRSVLVLLLTIVPSFVSSYLVCLTWSSNWMATFWALILSLYSTANLSSYHLSYICYTYSNFSLTSPFASASATNRVRCWPYLLLTADKFDLMTTTTPADSNLSTQPPCFHRLNCCPWPAASDEDLVPLGKILTATRGY